MCDCYTDKCRGCGKGIEMHLSDYDTGRNEIEVYCGKCLPKDLSDGVLWKYKDDMLAPPACHEWQFVFVRALTDNAKSNADGNHPNQQDMETGIPEGTLAVTDERLQLPTKDSRHHKGKSRRVARKHGRSDSVRKS